MIIKHIRCVSKLEASSFSVPEHSYSTGHALNLSDYEISYCARFAAELGCLMVLQFLPFLNLLLRTATPLCNLP